MIAQSAVYMPQSAVYMPQSAIYTPQSAVYRQQNAVYLLQNAVYMPQSAVYTPQGAVYMPQSTVNLPHAVDEDIKLDTFEVAQSDQRLQPQQLEPTFINYVNGGCGLRVLVAIDYTASNVNPWKIPLYVF